MKKYYLYIFLIFLIFSCKKQELTGGLAYLEGKWKLTKVINYSSGTVLPPQGSDVRYLKFKHSGKIILSNASDNVIERGRIVSFNSEPSNIYTGGIDFRVNVSSNALFNKTLNKINFILLISTNNSPLEFITNDIIYGSDNEIELVFQKI